MGRCGCGASGTTTVAITGDDEGIDVTGAGTIASPYVVAPVVDPDGDNMLTSGPDGLLVSPIADNITMLATVSSRDGTPPAAADGGFKLIAGTQTVLLNGDANGLISFPNGGFDNGLLVVVPANGDANTGAFVILLGASNKAEFTVNCAGLTASFAGALVRIDYIAIGW